MKQICKAGEQVLLPPRLTAIRQDLLPEGPAEVQSLQHRVAVAGVPKLKITYGMQHESGGNVFKTLSLHHRVSFTYIDKAKVVLIDWKLLRSNFFLQSRGIGAL